MPNPNQQNYFITMGKDTVFQRDVLVYYRLTNTVAFAFTALRFYQLLANRSLCALSAVNRTSVPFLEKQPTILESLSSPTNAPKEIRKKTSKVQSPAILSSGLF